MSTYAERLKSDLDWHGHLTLENAEAVADRIRSMIGDNQRYTWVSSNEYSGHRPEVRTSQTAKKVEFTRQELDDGRPWAHLMVVDTYGVWGLSTTLTDDAALKDVDHRDVTRLSFTHCKLLVEHYAPSGNHLYWAVALEDERSDGAS